MDLMEPFDLQELVLDLQGEIGQLKNDEMATYEVLAQLICYLQQELGQNAVERLLSELNHERKVNGETN